jgi:hypothetical protein
MVDLETLFLRLFQASLLALAFVLGLAAFVAGLLYFVESVVQPCECNCLDEGMSCVQPKHEEQRQ